MTRLWQLGVVACVASLLSVCARDGRRRDSGSRVGRATEGGGGAPFGYSGYPPQPPALDERPPAYSTPNNYQEASNDHRFSNRGGVGQGSSTGYQSSADGSDVVPAYTRTLLAKSLVATTSAASSTLLFFLGSKMIFSKASMLVSLVLGLVCSLSCFTNGDLGSFSKALGVFTLLMSRRTKPGNFLLQLLRNLRSLLMLSVRRPFPPTDNPWKYGEPPRGTGIPFSMMNVMIGVVVSGFFTGWSVSKLIPFFPSWLGSIGFAVVFGYQCTLRDAKGDLFRYLGYAVNSLLSEVVTTLADVMLREKTSILTGKIFAFVHRLDQNYQILAKIQLIIAGIIAQITGLISRVQNDMAGTPQGQPIQQDL